jgi:hypothetical protein
VKLNQAEPGGVQLRTGGAGISSHRCRNTAPRTQESALRSSFRAQPPPGAAAGVGHDSCF